MTEDIDPATPESLQVPKDRDGFRFWAVLIGVDGNPHYPLHGCVSDALMEKYLVEDFGIPSDHIQRLLGPTGGKPPMVLQVLLAPISSRHFTASLTTLTSYLGITSSSTLLEMPLSYQPSLSVHWIPWTVPLGTITGPKSLTSAFEKSKPFSPKYLWRRVTRSRSSSIVDTRVRESEVFL
ncbi:hypothetical protein ARMGADRAFT_1011518 [Armillaria gallica]|uniref:Uncharacterized protein n=1 Tax=Armillaria gallica TaxID=47427 RepID=A0A2H3E4H7_ARMGA|nr:hypothetical protein ARMGADRAFT_1011518 [Armillaria gallica]